MKDTTYNQVRDVFAAVELDGPVPAAGHAHFVAPKWSLTPRAQRRTTNNIGNSYLSAVMRSWNRHQGSASVSTIGEPLMRSDTAEESPSHQGLPLESSLPFLDRYGRCLEILHYGFNSTVRLHQGRASPHEQHEQLFAVKVYSRNTWALQGLPIDEISFSPRRMAELHAHPQHRNILRIADILCNKRSQLCLVMPYYSGGNLHDLLCEGPIPAAEIDCLAAQILRGLAFLHGYKIAHCDIRLETVLLTANGAVKLAGFSDEYIRRLYVQCAVPTSPEDEDEDEDEELSHSTSQPSTWSFSSMLSSFLRTCLPQYKPRKTHPSSPSASHPRIRLPYLAPENFLSDLHRWYHNDDNSDDGDDDDPRPADIWATGIIYLTLIIGRLPWRSARAAPEDPRFTAYLQCRRGESLDGYPPIEAIGERRRRAVYAMLNPNPRKRVTAVGLLQSAWMEGVVVCEAGERGL
ncbi:kinase-like domain-containing protein [Aspergillus lucknowensis]|uniref:Kinase-like domain-containing protein n=1 Tax=Aspergillus lucknowensis TaxID=176173 RepID=A0ABR4LMM0_9EURO